MNMAIVQPRTPSGFPEHLPGDQIEFNRLMGIVRSVYEEYGFAPLDTPDLELSDILLTKSGGETEQQVYRFKKGSNDLTMRFDLTVPLARYAAQHESELVFPFRRYHLGKVHRGERAQAGRFREFYQCDIDVIGSKSLAVDAELPAIINEVFSRFDFGEFTIRINNRMILNGFFEGIGIGHVSVEVLRVIDKIEKISRNDLVSELIGLGLSDAQVQKTLEFTEISGDNEAIIQSLRGLDVVSDTFAEGVEKISTLIEMLRMMGVPESRFIVDLKIARGLDYYTGTVYETTLNDHPEIGSVCSGGRYDNLASHYTKTDLPGVGISIGLSRLFYKLKELGVVGSSRQSPARIVVMPLGEAQLERALFVATLMRRGGCAVMLYAESNDLRRKMRYADKMGFEWVVLIGEKEQQAGKVMLKCMATGETLLLNDEAVLEAIGEADRTPE